MGENDTVEVQDTEAVLNAAITDLDAKLKVANARLDNMNIHLSAVRTLLAGIDPQCDLDELKDTVKAIADELGERNPFIEDISDIQSEAEDLFSSLDNLLYSVQEAQSRLDTFIGMCYDYSDGVEVDLETRDDFEERLESIKSDWENIIEFAENGYY